MTFLSRSPTDNKVTLMILTWLLASKTLRSTQFFVGTKLNYNFAAFDQSKSKISANFCFQIKLNHYEKLLIEDKNDVSKMFSINSKKPFDFDYNTFLISENSLVEEHRSVKTEILNQIKAQIPETINQIKYIKSIKIPQVDFPKSQNRILQESEDNALLELEDLYIPETRVNKLGHESQNELFNLLIEDLAKL